MGRAAMLMVLALMMAFAYIGINMRSTSRDLTQAHSGYFMYTNARNLARTAIHRYLRYIDGIPGYTGSPITSGTFGEGSYAVTPTTSGDTLWLTSVGTYVDSSYTMKVKLLFTPKPFPMPSGAVGITAEPASMTFTGKATVDGHNWDSTGTTLTGSGDLPGVAVMTAADSANIAASGAVGTSDPNIAGSPAVAVNPNQVDPAAFIAEYEQSAHYYFNTPGNVSGNWTFGSASNPVIVVCNAGEDTSFYIRFTGSIIGHGILAINGNVKFAGGFEWYGLVVAYGIDNVVTFEMLGNPQIVGGVIVAGNQGASLTLKGTGTGGKVKYSSQALDKARRIGRLLYYSVLEWYE